MPQPTGIVGVLKLWSRMGVEGIEGFVYNHSIIRNGTHMTFCIKSLTEYSDCYILKTDFTEQGCGYRLPKSEEITKE